MRAHLFFAVAGLLCGPEWGLASQPAYPVAVARGGTWSARTQTQGRVSASRDQVVSAPFALRVQALRVRLGEQVGPGTALAEVQAPELQALREEFAQAERQSALAEERVRDAERRLETRFATRDAVLRAKAAWSEAQGRADRAWAALSESLVALGDSPRRSDVASTVEGGSGAVSAAVVVLSRFPGRVVAVDAAAGVDFPKGAPLFRMKDLSAVFVDVRVPLSAVPAWRQGSASAVRSSGQSQPLRLAAAEPALDSSTGLAALRYECANRTGLLDGEWVKVVLSGAARRAVWVPEAAVVGRGGRTYCLVERGGRYEAVVVEAGPPRKGEVPVVGGLAPGERVVTDGAYELLYRDLNQLMKQAD